MKRIEWMIVACISFVAAILSLGLLADAYAQDEAALRGERADNAARIVTIDQEAGSTSM